MANKALSIVNGQVGDLVVKALFENKSVVSKVSIDTSKSDLKGLVTIGTLVPDTTAGTLTVPLTAVAEGVQTATIVFKYDDVDSAHASTENYGISTKLIDLTITAAEALAALSDVSTPLTMNLWESKNLTFKVMKGSTDITSSVTGVTVDADSIADKFEFSSSNGTYSFKSIKSDSANQVTATAKITVAGTDNGVAYSLPADINLVTNVNDGSIPTNRFDVQTQ